MFIKVPDIKFQENPPNWSPADNGKDGQTDGHNEGNRRFS